MPDHWQVVELGSLCERVKKKNSDGVDRVLTVAAGHGLVDQESYFNRRVAAKNLSGYSVIEKGTFVYNKSYSAAAPLGVIAASHDDLPGVVSPLYIVFRPVDPRVSPEFLELAVLSDITLKILGTFVKEGGRAHGGINISIGDFFSVPVPLPPQAEQRRMVDLVGSIDTYIDSLETQIETTRTARSALLSELLSNSGDDWQETTLGDVSEQVKRGRAPSYSDVGLMVLNQKCIRAGNKIDYEAARRTDIEVRAVPEWAMVRDGDVLVNSTGTGTAGRAALVSVMPEPMTVDSHVTIVRPIHSLVIPAFVGARLSSMASSLEELASGSTNQIELSRQAISAIALLLPPLAEQRRIVDLVGSFDEQISSLESQVESVRALRSGVLSELLSGERLLDDSYDMAVGL